MPRKGFLKNAKNICTHFPKKEIEQIEEQAEKVGMNRSELIRDAVRRVLPKDDKTGGAEDKKE